MHEVDEIVFTWESEAPEGEDVSKTNTVPLVAPASPMPPFVAEAALRFSIIWKIFKKEDCNGFLHTVVVHWVWIFRKLESNSSGESGISFRF